MTTDAGMYIMYLNPVISTQSYRLLREFLPPKILANNFCTSFYLQFFIAIKDKDQCNWRLQPWGKLAEEYFQLTPMESAMQPSHLLSSYAINHNPLLNEWTSDWVIQLQHGCQLMHCMSMPSINLWDPKFFLLVASVITTEWSDSFSPAGWII